MGRLYQMRFFPFEGAKVTILYNVLRRQSTIFMVTKYIDLFTDYSCTSFLCLLDLAFNIQKYWWSLHMPPRRIGKLAF